jgi:hypothetical protein
MQRLVRLPSLSPLWREYVFPGRFQRASRTSQTPELPVLGGETRERDSKSSRKCSSMIVSWRAGCRCGFGFMVIPPSPSIHRRGFVWRDELTMSAWFVLNASVTRRVQRALIVESAREAAGPRRYGSRDNAGATRLAWTASVSCSWPRSPLRAASCRPPGRGRS